MKYIVSLSLVIFFSLFFIKASFAQEGPADTLLLDISLIPSNPEPQQRTIARVTTLDGNINRANLVWFLNGEPLDQGVGKTQVTFITPASGNTAVLTVEGSLDGLSGSASLTVIPGQVDLFWEAVDSYTPPFYKGKAIPSAMANIRVVAVPSPLAPRSIAYQWERNDAVLQGLSGAGRNSVTIKNTELVVTENIKVSIDSSQFQGENRIQITPRSPSIIVYPKNEGFIDFSRGSNETLSLSTIGTVLRIEPYFFSMGSSKLDDWLRFAYTFNGESYIPEGKVNEIEVSAPETGGTSRFFIEVESIREALQNVERRITLFFNQAS
jgi:hypothetical protein